MRQNLARGLVAAMLAVLAAATPAQSPGPNPAPSPRAPLKVAFVYVSPIGEAGWTFQHDQARLAMHKALGANVQTTVVEAVAEGADSERVMRDLAQQGHGLIVATSFGYLEPALRVAAEFPNVRFEHAGGYKTAPNLSTYNARFYEARYLAGMIAGQASRSGVAGYVAGFPVPEVVQGINAFTLGMRAVNPKAEVKLVWLNTWFDPTRERDAAQALVDQGADVLVNHSGSPAVPQTAQANFRAKGVRTFGYQSDMRRFAPDAQLAAVVPDWSGHYIRTAQAVLDSRWRPQPVWGGMKDGMVQLVAVDPALPAELRRLVEARRGAIVAGSFKPFSAPLKDNAGKLRLAQGALDDGAIATMNWLVEGVVGAVPGQ
jgi:basic membrane protein A